MSERQVNLMINAIRYGHGKRKILGKLYLIIHKYLQYVCVVLKLTKDFSTEFGSYRQLIGFRMLVLFFINTLYSSSSSNGATVRGSPRPPSRVSSVLSGFGRLLSNFYILALLHLPSLRLPSATWVYLWVAFLLAH